MGKKKKKKSATVSFKLRKQKSGNSRDTLSDWFYYEFQWITLWVALKWNKVLNPLIIINIYLYIIQLCILNSSLGHRVHGINRNVYREASLVWISPSQNSVIQNRGIICEFYATCSLSETSLYEPESHALFPSQTSACIILFCLARLPFILVQMITPTSPLGFTWCPG